MDTLYIDGDHLTIEDVCAVADGRAVALPPDGSVQAAMQKSRAFLEAYIAKGYPTYGVTTGFGDSCNSRIHPEKADLLQQAIVRYHGIGVGSKLPHRAARAVALCRLNSNIKGGYSAIRLELAELMLDLLNKDIIPVIPELGSVGASGDLTPLSYLGAVIMGERTVYYKGRVVPTAEAFAAEGIRPLPLAAKEGLAIMNGTSVMTALAALAWRDAARLSRISDFITAATTEITAGNEVPFRAKVSEIKNHAGQIESAAAVYAVLKDSKRCYKYEDLLKTIGEIGERGYEKLDVKIQNRYSIRCAPQINGVLRDTLRIAKNWIEEEINSANDNPLIDAEAGAVFNTGNFYGGHICAACDYLRIALGNISDLADKQAEDIIDGKFNGLTENLIPYTDAAAPEAGLRFGFKAAQITISALRAEIMHECAPVSIHSSPTEALNQDKVSLGTIAARKLRDQIELLYLQFGVHLLAVAQAIDLIGRTEFSPFTQKVHAEIRAHSAFVQDDRPLDTEAETIAAWLQTTALFADAGGR